MLMALNQFYKPQKNVPMQGEWTNTFGIDRKSQQGLLLEFAWKMKRRGLAEITIKNRIICLNHLPIWAQTFSNPDSVETILATETFRSAGKKCTVKAYAYFTKALNIPWEPIKVNYSAPQPFIPLESEIDQLIAACGKMCGTFLQILKDTGAPSWRS